MKPDQRSLLAKQLNQPALRYISNITLWKWVERKKISS